MLKALSGLFWPVSCPLCGSPSIDSDSTICARCYSDFPRTVFFDSPENRLLNWMQFHVPLLKTATALFQFKQEGKLQQGIHAFKYLNRPDLAQEFGRLLGEQWLDCTWWSCAEVCLVPVPLADEKQQQRGYNQAEKLAQGIAEVTGWEVDAQIITRQEHGESQTQYENNSRWENVGQAFRVNRDLHEDQRAYMLVDDVLTTGATLCTCAQHLCGAGASSVHVCALASAFN